VRVLGRDLASLKVVVSGAGASGVACAKILQSAGATDVVVLDSRGIIHAGREGMNVEKIALAEQTNPRGVRGDLAAALSGADVFLGLSGSTVPESVIASMAEGAIVFALSNPDPEIDPEVARKHAAVVATGRSDYPNQINNVLAFPGVFAGALDAAARRITEAMKLAAAEAIADIAAGDEEFGVDHIVPSALDHRVAPAVAEAVARAASEEGVVRRHVAEVAAEGHH
jgi:malate dehydrogenase (oxaloacetate-decarboxylating)